MVPIFSKSDETCQEQWGRSSILVKEIVQLLGYGYRVCLDMMTNMSNQLTSDNTDWVKPQIELRTIENLTRKLKLCFQMLPNSDCLNRAPHVPDQGFCIKRFKDTHSGFMDDRVARVRNHHMQLWDMVTINYGFQQVPRLQYKRCTAWWGKGVTAVYRAQVFSHYYKPIVCHFKHLHYLYRGRVLFTII